MSEESAHHTDTSERAPEQADPTQNLTEKAVAFVEENKDRILSSNYQELVSLGRENGFDDRDGYVAYKDALLSQANINMFERREAWAENNNDIREKEFANASTITLRCCARAAASKEGREIDGTGDWFALTDEDGTPVWAGKFFDQEAGQPQNHCDISVGKKAVYLAGKLSDERGKKVSLTLKTTARWLEATNQAIATSGSKGGSTNLLAKAARDAGIDLKVVYEEKDESPAHEAIDTKRVVKYKDVFSSLSLTDPAPDQSQGNSPER